ncbi:hypothetical protein [Actinoallomurus iriomotensis]|uniref:Uncharacterized protein n=1 Tax=Actinoallomurus iriomotensis TaxID=478107 RepID=A0A9W6RXE9_9ACTN|nr:hypothetical protein [Actinoallomurus iriomotensis]GLY81872.1 hypothetical protein Airi01_101390 [Actinoallomurus iriomotensis]
MTAIEDMTVAELREDLKLASREAYDAQRTVESLLMDRARWERETAAAIRRREWENVATRDDHYAKAEIQARVQPLDGVLYRIEQLGERAGAADIRALKDAARAARNRIAWARDTAPDTTLADAAQAETMRLRQVVTEQGRALHAELATGALPCRCPGCELIRAMDADAPSVREVLAAASEVTDG